MRLHRLLLFAAVVVLALAAVACSQQAEATDADVSAELDEGVYLGVGTTATDDGGRSAPGHFALVGPTDEWIGAEE